MQLLTLMLHKSSGSQPFFPLGRTMFQVQVSRAAYHLHIVMDPVPALPFTHNQRSLAHYYGLLHHTNCCTSPRTTFPIIHCTGYTHSCNQSPHFISHGLLLSHRRVLFAIIPVFSDSNSTEPVFLGLSSYCLV